MFTIESIIALIVAAAPALTAIIGIIAACIKLISANKVSSKEVITSFENLKQEVLNTKEYEDLKTQLRLVHEENVVLKKKLNELLTKIDHIERKED